MSDLAIMTLGLAVLSVASAPQRSSRRRSLRPFAVWLVS
jgi:hypothetical protein